MKRIITISREFGSGGRTIGRKAAERIGYSFYYEERIVNLYGETDISPEKRLLEKNKTRAMNYKYYRTLHRGHNRELSFVTRQR